MFVACGEQAGTSVPAAAPLETLPAPASAVSPGGSIPLHPLNNLLIGAPTVDHLEIAAAPIVESCMADAGFSLNLGAPKPGPATYGERERAALEGYVPSEPFFIEDAAADRYRELGDESESEQQRFAIELEGNGDGTPGCAELGRINAASPLKLSPEQIDQYGELIMSSILSPSMSDAEVRYSACVADRGVNAGDSGEFADLIIQAARNEDDQRSVDLYAINDGCAADTIDLAEIEASEIVTNELLERKVLTAEAVRQLLIG